MFPRILALYAAPIQPVAMNPISPAAIVVSLLVSISVSLAELRKWTSTDGRSLQAEFVSSDDKSVTIRRRNDGKLFTLPLESISEEDRKWVSEKGAKLTNALDQTETQSSKNNPYSKLITGDWERHESHGLEFRLYGERRLRSRGVLAPSQEPKSYPLVIYLHGRGGDVMTSNNPSLASRFSDRKNYRKRQCFIIAPQNPEGDNSWSGKNGESVIKIAEDLIKHLPVDKNRVYLTGYSMGAYGTFHLLAKEPKFFAAAVPIAGGGNPSRVRSHRKVPIWVFHGAKDEIVKVSQSQNMVEALKKAKADVQYTEYPDGDHGIGGQVYNDEAVHEWMFKQSRAK